ncbi:thromboxane-A synthase [Nematostella vectensis]|uniref:thromboxane-A synthase n=1 Tax=Nematostella vectensis TaxID=45351 RepID=UPI002076FBD4|nr:thromboxane-A synthase [Nematostella vectensis]
MAVPLEFYQIFTLCNSLVLACVLLIATIVWKIGFAPFSFLRNLGIPGPKPWPFIGNLPILYEKKHDTYAQEYLVKTYGRLCGYYMGTRAAILVADPEMAKQILVKEFDKFVNRPIVQSAQTPPTDKTLLSLQDDDWRRLRHTITPTFSAVKLKQVLPLINESCRILVEKLGEACKDGKSVDVLRSYGKFTMETIVTTAFGIDCQTQTNPNDQFVPNAQRLFGGQSLFRMLAESAMFIVDAARQIIKHRRETGSQGRKDLLEILLSAETTDDDGRRKNKLSDDEIVAQCFTFILAGYETTSNTMAFTSYLLALNPDKQDRLIEEIDEVAATVGDNFDYDTVLGMEYLDMVVQEALRLYPPGFRFGRTCNQSCTINGQFFPKGCIVLIPVFAMHRDPEIWPEPEKFQPERFTAEAKQARHPYAYLPFGGGPRNCIGMRFALLEAKMALVYILRYYRLERCPETEVPVQLQGTITIIPKHGIYLKITKR